MFNKILIANRGEIACRVAVTARRLAIQTVAVYSDADANAKHVAVCDESVHIGGSAPKDSYLRWEKSIAAAQATEAQAIHPGYGFLSENEEFAQACAKAGLVFIGPPASAILAMGLKAESKQLMEKAGVPLVPGYHGHDQDPALLQREADIAGAKEMLDDPDMVEMAREEIAGAEAELIQLEEELQRLLLPKDPDDARNAFVEIRAGTGGDESALFAGDLTRMYTRYAANVGWKVEVVSENAAELGGYKEIVLRIEGDHVYGALKFESGGHRVQRVPATETQGRIHTSACTVAVMPEPDEHEAIKLNPADLRIDTFRASGAGGQHINKTDSAVRVVHLPT
eukprot:gene16400-34244_t